MQTSLKNWNWRDDLRQLKEMLKLLLPKGKAEIILFIVFSLIYGTLATFIALRTNITDQPILKTDAYFSFDNAMISHHAIQNLGGHPLFFLFTFPLLIIGIIFNFIFSTIKAKALFLVLFCTYLTISSIIYVFRYLKEVINLSGLSIYLIACFYAFTSTIMVLSFTFESFTFESFTFESFTFSIYFLSFTIYYYSYSIKTNNKIPFINSLFLAISLGGITITNFIKGLIPIIFTDKNFKFNIRRIFILSSILLAILLVLEFRLNIFSEIQSKVEVFMPIDNVNRYITDLLFGAAILFPNVKIQYWTSTIGCITTDFYSSWWQYITIIIIASLSLLGIISNYKKN